MAGAQSLKNYLKRQYRFNVIADPDGGYVIEYPDLPGCMTQVEEVGEVSGAAREIFELWIEAALESAFAIPEPTYPEEYSGKFVLRLPKSLHRRLAERAEADGVSLNQMALSLIAEGLGRSNKPKQADISIPQPGDEVQVKLEQVSESPLSERAKLLKRLSQQPVLGFWHSSLGSSPYMLWLKRLEESPDQVRWLVQAAEIPVAEDESTTEPKPTVAKPKLKR
jgi:antitoxin HicB